MTIKEGLLCFVVVVVFPSLLVPFAPVKSMYMHCRNHYNPEILKHCGHERQKGYQKDRQQYSGGNEYVHFIIKCNETTSGYVLKSHKITTCMDTQEQRERVQSSSLFALLLLLLLLRSQQRETEQAKGVVSIVVVAAVNMQRKPIEISCIHRYEMQT